MAITKVTTRSSENPEHRFMETVEGGQPPSLEVTMNAKGLYQYAVKFYFRDAADLLENGSEVARQFDQQFRLAFPTPRGNKDGDE